MNVELLIANESGDKLFQPSVEEGIEWTTERRSAPGKLTFSVMQDEMLNFSEGSAVQLRVDGTPLFFGFIFTQKRKKGPLITVTAYDQLRYLKNKDSYVYKNMAADQVVKMIADDFSLKIGTLESTGYIIPARTEDNVSLFEMIENALDLTLQNNRKLFVLYDDFGELTLKSISSMYIEEQGKYLMVDEETGENFEYSSSIDSDTYNQVKLIYDNGETGKRDVYLVKDPGNINKWGILQYHDTLAEGENGQAKAEALLALYNRQKRNLKLTRVLGDKRVRAGSMIVVNLDLGSTKIANFMLVERVKHIFKQDEHYMDLTLRGGEFVA